MTENENMVVENVTPPAEQKEKKITWAKFVAGLKERLRKLIVNLKRRPTNIAFFILIVTSLVYLLGYSSISNALYAERTNLDILQGSGICSFITFLFSILVLILFMNSFPKRKKPNIVMLVLTGLFMAAMIATNVVCYIELNEIIESATNTLSSYYYSAERIYLAHIILIGITAVVLACTPLIKKGLMKINTKKDVESTEFKGNIDLENVEE